MVRPLQIAPGLGFPLRLPPSATLPVLLSCPVGVPHRQRLRVEELHMKIRVFQPNEKVVPGPRINNDDFSADVEKRHDVASYASPDLRFHCYDDDALFLYRHSCFFHLTHGVASGLDEAPSIQPRDRGRGACRVGTVRPLDTRRRLMSPSVADRPLHRSSMGTVSRLIA